MRKTTRWIRPRCHFIIPAKIKRNGKPFFCSVPKIADRADMRAAVRPDKSKAAKKLQFAAALSREEI